MLPAVLELFGVFTARTFLHVRVLRCGVGSSSSSMSSSAADATCELRKPAKAATDG